VDPDAVGWDLLVAVQVGELSPLDQDLVVLVEVEPQQWALELVEDWLAIAAHPDMGRALVEPVEGIGDGLVDAGGVAREPSDIDDGEFLGHLRPPVVPCLPLRHGRSGRC
jgi:hypothetical protein